MLGIEVLEICGYAHNQDGSHAFFSVTMGEYFWNSLVTVNPGGCYEYYWSTGAPEPRSLEVRAVVDRSFVWCSFDAHLALAQGCTLCI